MLLAIKFTVCIKLDVGLALLFLFPLYFQLIKYRSYAINTDVGGTLTLLIESSS